MSSVIPFPKAWLSVSRSDQCKCRACERRILRGAVRFGHCCPSRGCHRRFFLCADCLRALGERYCDIDVNEAGTVTVGGAVQPAQCNNAEVSRQ